MWPRPRTDWNFFIIIPMHPGSINKSTKPAFQKVFDLVLPFSNIVIYIVKLFILLYRWVAIGNHVNISHYCIWNVIADSHDNLLSTSTCASAWEGFKRISHKSLLLLCYVQLFMLSSFTLRVHIYGDFKNECLKPKEIKRVLHDIFMYQL